MLSQPNAAICLLPPTAMGSGEQNRGHVILEMMLETFEAVQPGQGSRSGPRRIWRRDQPADDCAAGRTHEMRIWATNAFSLLTTEPRERG
jgi:hypothetical protein